MKFLRAAMEDKTVETVKHLQEKKGVKATFWWV